MMTSSPFWPQTVLHALGWTLIDFLWEGLLVGLLLACALGCINRRASNPRYMVACSALAIMALLPIFTLQHVLNEGTGPTPPTNITTNKIEAGKMVLNTARVWVEETVPRLDKASIAVNSSLQWILIAWVLGVILLSGRLSIGLIAVRRIRVFAEPLSTGDVSELFLTACRRLEMNSTVQLLTSTLVQVPIAIGWLKPAVIMPIGTLTGLSTMQIEALLAHELAHIKRHDYFLNMLQVLMETVFFYHPCVWWASRQIRKEREYCCDDLALTVSRNPLAYAKALSLIEEHRAVMPIATLGADGGDLLLRIRRLLGYADMPPISRVLSGTLLTFMLVALVGACVAVRASWAVGHVESSQLMSGYNNLSVQDLADLQHYGVTPTFANSMNTIGFEHASVDQLVRLTQYGVDPQYAAAIKRVGLANLTLEDVISFHQYGVSPEYVAGMYAMGYRKPNEILQLQQQGISLLQVNALHRDGYRALAPRDIAAHIHGPVRRTAFRTIQ